MTDIPIKLTDDDLRVSLQRIRDLGMSVRAADFSSCDEQLIHSLGFIAGVASRVLATGFITDPHDARVRELLEANNREVERRRAAVAALRHLRQRFGQPPGVLGAALVMDVDGKSVWVPEFIDAAIAAAEPGSEPGSGNETK